MIGNNEEFDSNADVDNPEADVTNVHIEPKQIEERKARYFDIIEFLSKIARTGHDATFSELKNALRLKQGTLGGYLKELVKDELIESVRHGVYRLKIRSMNETLFERHAQVYEARRQRNRTFKEAVARACVEYERDGASLLGNKCCLICHGTSTEPLFRLMREVGASKRPDKIITNSIPGILELLDFGIGLTIIGGSVKREMGGIQPIHAFQGEAADDATTAERLGTEDFDTAIVSCSSIHPDGRIWCNDGMEQFRNGVLGTKEVNLIILADSTKLKTMSSGMKMANRIVWDRQRTWLFVDDHKTPENEAFYDGFAEKLGNDHFVRVKVDEIDQNSK